MPGFRFEFDVAQKEAAKLKGMGRVMNRTLLIAMGVLLVSCSSGGSKGGGSTESDSEAFEGTCTGITGGDTVTCGTQVTTDQYSGALVISSGNAPSEIVSVDDGCTVVWDVAGDVATLQPSQVCDPWTWSSATTMTLNGNTITIVSTGVGTVNGVQCTIKQDFSCSL